MSGWITVTAVAAFDPGTVPPVAVAGSADFAIAAAAAAAAAVAAARGCGGRGFCSGFHGTDGGDLSGGPTNGVVVAARSPPRSKGSPGGGGFGRAEVAAVTGVVSCPSVARVGPGLVARGNDCC